jgi:hypothetical protein
MKSFILSIATLATLSTAALAERSYDLRDSAEARGSFTIAADSAVDGSLEVNTLAAQGDDASSTTVYFGKYGSTTDPMEARRWDEKNG